MLIRRPRASAVAVSALVAPMLLLGAAGSAQAAPTGEQSDSGAWLAGELVDGLAGPADSTSTYGLSIDTYVALDRLDVEAPTRAAIADAVEANGAAYFGTGDPGTTGKTAVLALLDGRDASDFGGVDLLGNLQDSVVQTDDESNGWARNVVGTDYSGGYSQPFVVSALVLAEDPLADDAATFLAAQQCGDGGFRSSYADFDPTTFANTTYVPNGPECFSDLDGSLFALNALLDADEAGIDGLGDDIEAAADYVVANQAADGSLSQTDFTNGGTYKSSNSTGLAASSLDRAGESAAALKAADWVRSVMVTPALAGDGSPLAGEAGAIAASDTDFAEARTSGIDEFGRSVWLRATAQAALALTVNPDADSIVAQGAPAEAAAGSEVVFTFAGLAPNESVEVTFETAGVAGRSVGFAAVALPTAVTAAANGTASVSVTIPSAVGPQTILVRGLGTGRTGSVSFVVVPAAVVPGAPAPGGGSNAAGPGALPRAGATDDVLAGTGSPVAAGWLVLAGVAVVTGSALLVRKRVTSA